MKRFLALGLAFLFIALIGCSKDSPTGPAAPQESGINIVSMSPGSPSTLKYYQSGTNDRVSVTYNYNVVEPDGARIWVQPVDNSDEGTVYYSPSPVLKGQEIKLL